MKNNIELSSLQVIHNMLILLNRFYRYFFNLKDQSVTNIIIAILAVFNIYITLELSDPVLKLVVILLDVVLLSYLYIRSFKLDQDNNEKRSTRLINHDLHSFIFTQCINLFLSFYCGINLR